MTIDLYYSPISGPSRIVLLTAYLADVDINLKLIDLASGDHMKPEYVKMNPQHNVPFIHDDGFFLNESKAIAAYLVNKTGGKAQRLYPEDAQQRALVDSRLNFEASVLFPNFTKLYVSL